MGIDPIHETNLSVAWAKAFLVLHEAPGGVLKVPLLISLECANGLPDEDASIQREVNSFLCVEEKMSIKKTASTIFPFGLWNMLGQPGIDPLTEVYLKQHYPRLRKMEKLNRYGTYFERLVRFRGTKKEGNTYVPEHKNQLKHIIDCWADRVGKGTHPKHSSLQATCFDPVKDLTGQVMRGFPCLQHIAVNYTSDHLTLNAFYHTEYIFDRGYGNYLGLCHLGNFLAEQMGLSFSSLNCYIAHPELGGVNKGPLNPLADFLREWIENEQASD